MLSPGLTTWIGQLREFLAPSKLASTWRTMPSPDDFRPLHVVYSDTSGFGGHIIAVTRDLSPTLNAHMRQELVCSTDTVWLVMQGGSLSDGWEHFEPTVLAVCPDRESALISAWGHAADWVVKVPLDWELGRDPIPDVIDFNGPIGGAVRYSR